MSTSSRNPESFRDTIEKIASGKVVPEIVIRAAAGNVTSIIKTGSVKRMDFKEADTVFTTIKATEVCIESNRSFFVLPRSGAVGWITARSDRAVLEVPRSTKSSTERFLIVNWKSEITP